MITIFTGLHEPGNKYIEETYRSLLAQRSVGWEWSILENNGGVVPESIRKDPRVTVLHRDGLNGVGAVKRTLCMGASTEYQFELDADDLLHPEALAKTVAAFEAGADFVFSDVAEFKGEQKSPVLPYEPVFGWSSYLTEGPDGKLLNAMHQPPVTPQNMRYIYWAPNHLRAWTKEAYLSVGGHEAGMLVADDHDLVVRMYLAGKKFHHIPECLYYYRIHDENTVKTRNAEIQVGTNVIYDRFIWQLAEKFADDNELSKVDLCCWKNCKPGYLGLDKMHTIGETSQTIYSMSVDLDKHWPLDDDSVGVIRAIDAIEHLKDPVHVFNEAYRVLAPGGFFLTSTPSTNGLGAWADPTHVSFYNKLSFRYYTSQRFADYVPGFKGRFQELRVQEYFPDDWHRENNVPYVEAHIVCQKAPYWHMGSNGWYPENG